MNKKAFALIVVPLMMVMSGALAFSAFNGTITTNVSASAGDMTFSMGSEIHGSYFHNTFLTVTGGNGENTVILTGSNVVTGSSLATVPVSGGAKTIVYWLNISNLAPGNWVGFTFTLVNTGSVGLIFNTPTIGTVVFDPATSPPDLNLTNATLARDSQGPSTSLFQLGQPLSDSSLGVLFANNYQATNGGQGQSGYVFAFGNGGPTFSNFQKSRDLDNSADFNFYVGLSSGAGNGYEESSISIPIIITVVSDP